MHSVIHTPVFHISPVNRTQQPAIQNKIDQKTKPLGALGQLESVALQIGLIQDTLSPQLTLPHVLVCAGDHGAAKAGVSAYPQDVTWQMVENFLAGGAAINVFTRQTGIALVVADAGVNHDFGVREGLIDAKIAHGTENYLDGAAMTVTQCVAAINKGAAIVRDIHKRGCNIIGFGEMGIGNTASASLLTHVFTGVPLDTCTGRGTGLDDAGLQRKRELLTAAFARWQTHNTAHEKSDALATLAQFGGFEIAMLAGAMLAAAELKMVLLIDGFIVTSALLAAVAIAPAVLDYCVFSHCSHEAGHRLQLQHLQAQPLLDLGLRLGEGTGAALAYPLLQAACAFMQDMASFESASVSNRE
ncbi:MAG TPA: nicotinate-nucleotide--dimethylbenzimidazole phosphoribosyltransferase [Pseudomonadales bacterium]|nr:nicotinate-nucleotide--dimethylbenzimidazole phosphoribosyltransferase [Pseudomonadales bacterium]